MANTDGSSAINYCEDELNPPTWMSHSFFEEVLKNCNPQSTVEIIKTQISPATTKNDHYGSVMFRASINYTIGSAKDSKTISLIVKTLPENGKKLELLKDASLFETEIKMYSEALPKIESVLRKYEDNTILGAKALYYSLSPQKCIVFEDLFQKGYRTSKRAANLIEAKAALLKIAKLHAVSYKLGKENDKLITSFNDGLFGTKEFIEMDMVAKSIPQFKDAISEFDELKDFVTNVEKIEKDILQKCHDTFCTYQSNKQEGIFVLNHGDFHIKNLMFKWNSSGELEDIMLVDYQLSSFGPNIIDVMYSVVTLMSKDLRYNHRNELMYYYFTNFQDTLKLINYEGSIPTMFDFQIELLKHRHFEVFLLCGFLPVISELTSADGDLAQVVEDPEYTKKLLRKKSFIDEIRILLPKYLHMGYFD